eukprot:EG_transcript_35850
MECAGPRFLLGVLLPHLECLFKLRDGSYRHHAQITHRGLQKSLFETHEEMRRRVEELTHEKERQALRLQGALEEAQQQDQQHIAHLQRVAQEQDVQFYEQLQAVADSKHRMAAKVKRAKSQLSELK